MTTKRFDAILFDAGGVLIMPDPMAIGAALDRWVGPRPVHAFHRAHYLALSTLERSVLNEGAGHLESVDWTLYRRAYASSIGVPGEHLDQAVTAMNRIWSPIMWRFRIEETMGALWQLRKLGVPMGVVSNASGQVEHSLRYEGVCQVGAGAGVQMVCVIDSDVVGVSKPDPAIFVPALAALGDPKPARVAYIGDSFINDVAGAAAAGLTPLHLDPYDDYADFDHERISSVHDLLGSV